MKCWLPPACTWVWPKKTKSTEIHVMLSNIMFTDNKNVDEHWLQSLHVRVCVCVCVRACVCVCVWGGGGGGGGARSLMHSHSLTHLFTFTHTYSLTHILTHWVTHSLGCVHSLWDILSFDKLHKYCWLVTSKWPYYGLILIPGNSYNAQNQIIT